MFNNINQVIQKNLLLFFSFVLLWSVCCMAVMLWRRSRRGPLFPALDSVKVLFRERFASGASHKSLITRLGGAQNCLTITLTDSELWVTTFFPFTAIAGFYDLDHKIALECINDIQRIGKRTTIDFVAADGNSRRIVLSLRQADQFFEAITPLLGTK